MWSLASHQCMLLAGIQALLLAHANPVLVDHGAQLLDGLLRAPVVLCVIEITVAALHIARANGL